MWIIGHRGCVIPKVQENTLAAFSLALKAGVDMIEFDVQLTSDSKIIVFHDHIVDRLTKLSGFVADFTYQQLQPYGIPLLGDVLKLIGKQAKIYVELKSAWTPDQMKMLINQVSDWITSNAIDLGSVYLASFNYGYCQYLISTSTFQVGYITCNDYLPPLDELSFVCMHLEMLTDSAVRQIKDADCKLFVFTVKRKCEMRNLLNSNYQVDGVVVDRPAMVGEVLCISTPSRKFQKSAPKKFKKTKKFKVVK